MLHITSVLALFSLLALSTAVYFLSKRIKLPYTVLLVLTGLLLVPLVKLPILSSLFGFIGDLTLTPELLFYIFLPILIFESAFNMNIRRMVDSSWAISLLAVVGLVISTLLVAGGLYLLLPVVGVNVPFIITLLFGAIISSTDPVAVLSLFKEFGAPKRLTMIFEGESLFNDGTAVAIFLVILGIATNGFHGASTILEGILMFVGMVVFGIIFGLFMAILFTRAIRFTRQNEFVTVTLLIISAHLVFILCELINEAGVIHISSIIATTITALFLGNQARNMLSVKTEEYLSKFVEHTAFLANSLVFILAGLLFASLQIDVRELWLPILVSVIIVAIVRVIAVYSVVRPLNAMKIEEEIPNSWQILLAWGSLRGALAIIIVLLIPDDLQVAGWQYAYSPKDFLLAITIGCILATLFIKAPLIGKIMHRLKIDKPDPLTLAHEANLRIYAILTEKARFEKHRTKGFVRDSEYRLLVRDVTSQLEKARSERDSLAIKFDTKLFEQSLHIMAVSVERLTLRELYQNSEVSENTLRKILGKLNLQLETIEAARLDDIDPTRHMDRKDIFDRLVTFMQTVLVRKPETPVSIARLEYYRAQMVMARKAVKVLTEMQREFNEPVFYEAAFKKIIEKYELYRTQNAEKVDRLLEKHSDELAPYMGHLAKSSLTASARKGIDSLRLRGVIDESIEDHELLPEAIK